MSAVFHRRIFIAEKGPCGPQVHGSGDPIQSAVVDHIVVDDPMEIGESVPVEALGSDPEMERSQVQISVEAFICIITKKRQTINEYLLEDCNT